ncbi:unnamed protein product [Effrenium voratum]|nr:unnamed protein product [Effrenium voratum]
MLCLIITPLAFLILLLIAIFNVCLARLLTAPGAVLFNLGVLWLVLRLVVRVLVFPGSILLWRRNTEASYRSEMAKQFAGHLEHLRGFLAEATGKGQGPAAGATLEGTLLGFMVVEGLSRNFQVQQRDQVKFTKEQAQLRSWVQAVELWLSQAKVMDRRAEIPLNDWLQRQSQNVVKVPLRYAVNSSPLASSALAEAEGCLQRLEQMLHMFYDLQRSPDGLCASTRRFLSTPPVGSLNQLRAELLLRYSAQHYWVRTQGRKIDAVFISAKGSGHLGEDSPEGKEDMPLKEPDESPGPVVVWCNPNAAYYETMAYESHWLDFYLSQGCSIFVFNYSGFGRSEGAPTPGRLSADGEAVVDFLRRRGFTQVAVHGRSIGGIAACRIAKNNPDIVKVLVADRTFSTLSRAAKFTFGDWAAKARGRDARRPRRRADRPSGRSRRWTSGGRKEGMDGNGEGVPSSTWGMVDINQGTFRSILFVVSPNGHPMQRTCLVVNRKFFFGQSTQEVSRLSGVTGPHNCKDVSPPRPTPPGFQEEA